MKKSHLAMSIAVVVLLACALPVRAGAAALIGGVVSYAGARAAQVVGDMVLTYDDATSAGLLGLDAARAPAWEFRREEFAVTGGDAGAPVKGAAASIEISAFGVGATDVTLVADIALKADYPFSFADWLRDARRMECLRVWSGGTPGRWETAHVPEEASIVRQQGNAGVGASVELRVPRTADDALFYKVEVGNDAAR